VSGAAAPGSNDPEAILAEIEATRAQLGRTVDELSHRLDVPARAREGAYRARDTAVETYRENPPIVLGAVVALAAAVVGLVVWRRKSAHPRRNKR
jgi:cytochrome P450